MKTVFVWILLSVNSHGNVALRGQYISEEGCAQEVKAMMKSERQYPPVLLCVPIPPLQKVKP